MEGTLAWVPAKSLSSLAPYITNVRTQNLRSNFLKQKKKQNPRNPAFSAFGLFVKRTPSDSPS